MTYNADQPRDSHGRWGGGGGEAPPYGVPRGSGGGGAGPAPPASGGLHAFGDRVIAKESARQAANAKQDAIDQVSEARTRALLAEGSATWHASATSVDVSPAGSRSI